MDWLIGDWERSNLPAGREAYEFWRLDEHGNLKGLGISINNGDTTFIEHLNIKEIDGVYYYIADVPENPEPVRFTITSSENGVFKSSNPNHDFPKAIDYRLRGKQLLVELSGDGKRVPFEFVKMK